jgi:hypothetical protein
MTRIPTRPQNRLLAGLLNRFARKPKLPAESASGLPAVAPEIHASIHDAGLMLLHIPTGRIFQSNRIGAKVWQGISNGLNQDTISEEISREYGVSLDLVRQNTSVFIAQLEEQGFVTRMGTTES